MNKKIIIRKAEIGDFNEIHKLIMQVHQLHIEKRDDIYKNVDPTNFEEFKKELSNSNNIYLVAHLENKIVGICFSEIKQILNSKIMKDRKILNIGNICVDEKYRRNGIGKSLYNQIIKIAKEQNIHNVELMVWGFNKNAIEFYESLGMNVKNIKFEQHIQ